MIIKPSFYFLKSIKRLSKKYPSLKNDIFELGESLKVTPIQGTFIGKNCYKIRLAIASKGRGKSGGGRVITCVQIVDDVIYLVAIYDKSDQESMNDTEIDDILRDLGLEQNL
jgi:mRNA-degrading endonuclease RelE of RelBE toxin-antitoxin system